MDHALRSGWVRAHGQWVHVRVLEELPDDLVRVEYVEPVLQLDDLLPKVVPAAEVQPTPTTS
jgi:hypothetical protein